MLLAKAKELDKNDPLKRFRDDFILENNTVYLDGNSLGPLPKTTQKRLFNTIEEEWGKRLIRSWNENWLQNQKSAAAKIAKLINAEPDEVIITDSVSVNLYKLVFGSLSFQKHKSELITDNLNFPSDLYIFQETIKQSFPDVKYKIVEQGAMSEYNDKILAAINENTAIISLSMIAYQSCFKYDVKGINTKIAENKALNLWDLSHAIGAIPIDVKAQAIDMAVGCTYKYLNAGPGAPAFLYIKKELALKIMNPIAGWFSHKNPFDFSVEFESNISANRFAVGTPPILSLMGIEEGVDLHLAAGSLNIWQKSTSLFDFFNLLYGTELKSLGFEMGSPIDNEQRGSHIALLHEEAYRINLSLIHPYINSKVFITDHRPPNIIRIALTPLYQQFEELYYLVFRLKEIVENKEYNQHPTTKNGVI